MAPASRLVIGAQHDVGANVVLDTGSEGPTYRFMTDPPDITDRMQAHRAGVPARRARLSNDRGARLSAAAQPAGIATTAAATRRSSATRML